MSGFILRPGELATQDLLLQAEQRPELHAVGVEELRHRLRGEPGPLQPRRAHRRTLFNSLTLRTQPPAMITYEQMDKVLERLDATLADVRVLPSQGGLVAH